MGYKKVCLECRKAFNKSLDLEKTHTSICPNCKKPMTELNQLFQPPKQSDLKKWNIVNFLVKNGFKYNHIWEKVFKDEKGEIYGTADYAKYPQSMKDAKEFVKLYKEQAITE